MTSEIRTLELNFELATDDEHADLEQSAAVVRDTVSKFPGVDDVNATVSEPARLIDPVTLAAVPDLRQRLCAGS